MKKILICLSMMLAMTEAAWAAGTVSTPGCGNCGGTPTYQNYGPWQTGQGGEFTLILISGSDINLASYGVSAKNQGVANSFQTFCIEENEYIYPNTLSAYTIDPYASSGGVGGATAGQDYVSIGTAWLYSQFAKGVLAYDYSNTGVGRHADAALLQQAFWYLENEIALPATANKYLNEVAGKFSGLSGARQDSFGAYGVAALNIYNPSNPSNKHQTQLVFVPVPDAGFTLGLLGLGFIGLGLVSRKLKN